MTELDPAAADTLDLILERLDRIAEALERLVALLERNSK